MQKFAVYVFGIVVVAGTAAHAARIIVSIEIGVGSLRAPVRWSLPGAAWLDRC